MGIIEKIFGTHSHNELKRIYPIVDRIEALAPAMEALSDEELKGKTKEFKDRLNEGETLDDILPEAYAVVSVCVITEYSLSVVLFCTRVVLPRCVQVKVRRLCLHFRLI